jgi:RimJ/RimL family protein N-acetyltransferase
MQVLSGGPVQDQDLELRPATQADARALWRLANDPGVRQLSFRSEAIPLDAHEDWLGARLGSRETRLLIAELAGAFVGQLRYDLIAPGLVEVSFAVVAPLRGRGLGTRLLRRSLDSARALGARRVRALTLHGNEASRRAFLSAGYREAGNDTRHGKASLVLELEIPD